MKKILAPVLLLLLAFISFRCQKEVSYDGIPVAPIVTDPVTAILQGNVVDENGQPAAGVTIQVGSKTASTNAKGYFRIKNASLDKNVSLIIAEKTGYFKTYRVFSASDAVNQVRIKLLKKESAGTVDAAAGGVVTLTNGSTVSFGTNSFSKASGGAYTGAVKVYATYIDPTKQDISETIPGSFLANDKDNKRVLLASYGMMAVELESAAGEKLQLTTGKTAQLNFTIPSALQSVAPATIALWYVDEKTGIWTEEGIATKNGNSYSGSVKHFTYWNCDVPGPTVNATATFVDQNGQPITYADIAFKPVSGYYSAHGFTDSLGKISGPIPANTNLILEVRAPGPCYSIIYSQNIGPFSSATNLGTIAINNTQLMRTISGKLLNCSGSPVTKGFAEIEYDNIVRYVHVLSTGDFSFTFYTCGSAQTSCTILGVDETAGQQGAVTAFPLTGALTNTGNIVACGTSTLQYISYILDGVPVNLSNTIIGDNIFSTDTINVNYNLLFIQGIRSQAENISLDFLNNGAAGTFSLGYLAVGTYGNVIPVAPSNITLNNYPQAGGYFEGSFSAQFKDAQNVTHTVSGTLRVKRRI